MDLLASADLLTITCIDMALSHHMNIKHSIILSVQIDHKKIHRIIDQQWNFTPIIGKPTLGFQEKNGSLIK